MSGLNNEEEASEIMAEGAAVIHKKRKRKAKGGYDNRKARAEKKMKNAKR